ncbi:hypothetical protein [Marinobacterium aestuariivivens]|uniref:GguC protein n=1 Tax=Marinobacterium aestuariivivens TaxID=1698799 RepID=A0ABW1ZU05_9GAMM
MIWRVGYSARIVKGADSIYALAQEAISSGTSLAAVIERHGFGESVDLPALAADGRLDCPVRHPDPAHMFLTGTGLTHLGSASARDAMHAAGEGLSDSMKMFKAGLEGANRRRAKPACSPSGSTREPERPRSRRAMR